MMLETVFHVLALSSTMFAFRVRTTKDLLRTDDSPYPFVVVLHLSDQLHYRLCTGGLITNHWVLTAGRCIRDHLSKPMTVRYSNFTAKADETKLYSKVNQKFIHPNFVSYADELISTNDLGLLLVNRIPINPGKLLAINYRTMVGLPVQSACYRASSADAAFDNDPIHLSEGMVIPCRKELHHYGPAMCMALKCEDRDKFHSDTAGAILLYRGRIAGIGMLTGNVFPPVFFYSALSSSLDWIIHVVKTNVAIDPKPTIPVRHG